MALPASQILGTQGPTGPIPNAAYPTAGQGLVLDANGRLPVAVSVGSLRMLASDPVSPNVGEFWFRGGSLCVRSTAATTVRVALS